MNTKLRFKLIGILIILSLTGLIIFQGYWLKGLYDSLYTQMKINVEDAMRMADYKELFIRMIEFKKYGKEKYALYFGSSADSASLASGKDGITAINEHPDNTLQILFRAEEDEPQKDPEILLSNYLEQINRIENVVPLVLHNILDPIKAVSFHMYDSLLNIELKARNIDSRYHINLVYQADKNTTILQVLSKNHPGMPNDTTAAALDWPNAIHFDYQIPYNPTYHEMADIATLANTDGDPLLSNPFSYRLYLKSPARVVLKQMSGILASSFLLLILILIAFVYLLRTILKQKTVEELKSDFTNNMTHELKTPISISFAAVDSLLNFDSSLNTKQQKYLSIVKDQLTHLTGLVEQILSLSIENRTSFRLRPENINLNEIISSLIEQYSLKTDKNVIFDKNIADDILLVTDRTHLYNMLGNLIDNALKYSDKNPTLISLSIEKTTEEIWLTVTDNGPGISHTHINHIFDKFYRIPRGNLHDVKGHGLGLYYIKDMMEKQGGRVSVRSQINKGSSFTLHFKL